MKDSVEKLNLLINNVEKVIVGKTETIKLLIVGLLTNGHILIEDVPGTGKTMLSLAIAKSIGGDFKRIQFTPDLLPSDVTGGVIYNQKTGEFDFRKGPVFTNILLADEINRTTPRTQSGLLECMQEYRVTIDNRTFSLSKPFMVIATQNPIEFQGTYPLPEAQIDRFLMKINMGYLSVEEEMKVVTEQRQSHPVDSLAPVLTLEDVLSLQENVKKVELSEKIIHYIVKLVSATRKRDDIKLGASPRASISLMNSTRAWALLSGRDYVIPDDVHKLVFWMLRHRITVDSKTFMAGVSSENIVTDLLKKTPLV